MIATVPGATDICICGHNGLQHDATTQVCRFSKDPTSSCGCANFVRPGTIRSAPNSPALNGPSQGPNAVLPNTGNRNY